MSAAAQAFTVRQMAVEDIPEVYQLGAETFTADLWPMLYRGWDEYEVTTLFNTDGEYCLVAADDEPREDGPKIAGFVLGTVLSKPGSAWKYGYVVWLCARPAWQRAGVASRLVDKLIQRMVEKDKIRIVMADTDPQNERAVRFFEKLGFDDKKAHVYLTSNLERNPRYSELVSRELEVEVVAPRRKPRARKPGTRRTRKRDAGA